MSEKVATVFLTGDWIAYALTGERTLSTSDALSNGLLAQQSRKKADEVLRAAGFDGPGIGFAIDEAGAAAP